jgi:prolipoprotein diacylglyceryl transferase
VFAVWQGGLGIWGGIALAAVVGIWRVHRTGASVGRFMDAVAPAILVAQAIGRIGNYFNQELFGGPTTLPWALQIAPQYRQPGTTQFATFHPTFLYELIWDLALAAFLVWLGHHHKIRPQGLFALYVTGYSAFRIFEESLRVDYSQYFLGLRLNFFVASVLTLIGIIWFVFIQRRPMPVEPVDGTPSPDGVDAGEAGPESAEASTEGEEPEAEDADEETDEDEPAPVAERGER